MDFFQRQDQTRRVSRWLVVLFLLAVMAIVTATSLLVLLVFGQPAEPGVSVFSLANLQRQSGLLLTTAIGVTGVMLLASLYRSISLRGGGGAVARSLGGQRLDADTRDPLLRQLQNVVEEIALAAGVPVPEIYVLEQEQGINAFAAGYSPADAAIGVTRGTLEKLDRAELQGVIAHEFSHIINGDMRLNIRLMGLVFGILVLAIVGQRVLTGAYFFGGGRQRNNGAAAILAIGVGLLAIGYIGLFFGRWIKAAVARQRESLADASAVQFTRHPQGIAGALKKIAVYSDGALLQADSEEVSHMLFGEGSARAMFATHPPLPERIRAIEPGFQEEELKTLAERIKRGEQRRESAKQAEPERQSGGAAPFDARNIIDSIGQMDGETLAAAAAFSEYMPQTLIEAARRPASAPALALFLLLDNRPDVRARQLAAIRRHSGEAVEQAVHELAANHGEVNLEQRLPLLEAALPALKQRAPAQLQALEALANELSEADRRISPFEFLLTHVLRNYLRDARQPSLATGQGRAQLTQRQTEVAVSLAALAHAGNPQDREQAEAAFRAGAQQLQTELTPVWPDDARWAARLRDALDNLDSLDPKSRKRLVQAWIAATLHDDKAATAELELLRAFCHSVRVPMPPLV